MEMRNQTRPNFGRPNSGRPNSGRPNSGRPNSGRPNSGRPNSGRPNSDRRNAEQQSEYIERLIDLNRVAKVQKGGRRFAFSALVVVGNGAGKVGFAVGKALDVSEAVRKGMEKAKRNLVTINMSKQTIPHPIDGIFKCTKVRLLPAAPGTGVIAGGAVRAIMEACGIQDILAKTYGSRKDSTVIQAVMNGLSRLWNPKKIAHDRQISVMELWG